MRKSIAIKTLLRTPLKALLTFFLIAAASFALFSHVTDYAVMTRESANAESFYHGVAALDNSVPDVVSIMGSGDVGRAVSYEMEDKPWPTKEQIKEFTSLPGVTLADQRYMTAGLVEDYKRLVDKDYYDYRTGNFVLEGTYSGYEAANGSASWINLLLHDVTVLAGDITMDDGEPLKIETVAMEEDDPENGMDFGDMPRSFYDGLEKGTRCLVMGEYDETSGRDLVMSVLEPDQKAFCVIDGLGEDYLETEDFAYQKGMVEAARQDLYIYDIAYTSDMRSIPSFNERSMVIEQGRPLVQGDTDACVVNELFLETYHLSIGDRVSIKLGDRLNHQDPFVGAKALVGRRIPNFVDTVELEIVGAYRFVTDVQARVAEADWSYRPSTVFVPGSLLPVEIPDDYEPEVGEFSVLIENAHDIESFREAAEPFAAELNVGLRFSDGGWTSVKSSFETGSLTSFLATVLYAVGAALALLLAVYLYIGRNKTTYAIMRTLGVSGRMAGNSIVLPFGILSVLAIPAGGAAGLLYSSDTAARALEELAASAPDGYVPDTALSAGMVILCLFGELAFISTVMLLFLRKMKKTPPLELLQEGTAQTGAGEKAASKYAGTVTVPAELDIAKLQLAEEMETASQRKYGAIRHVVFYILRHMRRGIGKTAVSLVLAAVLTAGVGVFALAKLTYQDAFREVDVKGRALEFSSSAIAELEKSDLINDIYYYDKFNLCVNGTGVRTSMTLTNDFDRYLVNDHTVTYAEGYDSSVFGGTGQVCLMGQTLAADLGVRPGDEITLMTEDLYAFMEDLYEDKKGFQDAVVKAGKAYKVVGVLDSEDADINTGIFAAANSAAEELYGQPFPIGYCEFTLADNTRLDELDSLLETQKKSGMKYAKMASYHVDSAGLENVRRIRDLLESLFPIAVAVAVLIGLAGQGLVILQSAKEAAFLRILGVTKKRARCMLALEQILLCIIGIVLVAGGLFLYSPALFARSAGTLAICWTLYLSGGVCGAFAASIQVTRHRILELLQVKE